MWVWRLAEKGLDPFGLTVSQASRLVYGYYLNSMPFPYGLDQDPPDICATSEDKKSWRDVVCNHRKWIRNQTQLNNWLFQRDKTIVGDSKFVPLTQAEVDRINQSHVRHPTY